MARKTCSFGLDRDPDDIDLAVPGSAADVAAARRAFKTPKTLDDLNIDVDIFGTLLSVSDRTVSLLVSQDLDATMKAFGLAGGTGQIATIVLVGANPAIRPSVPAHVVRRDRSAMGKLLDAE